MVMNLTPHDVVVFCINGDFKIYPQSGHVLRALCEPQENLESYDGVLVVSPPKYFGVEGLPKGYEGDILVSGLCAPFLSSYPGRVFVPDTNNPYRDADGEIWCVRGFIEYY